MKTIKSFLAIALVSIALFACKKNLEDPFEQQLADAELLGKNSSEGYVYTLNNQAGDNKVMAFSRGKDGKLAFSASYSTGGTGTGGGLGNQGALALTGNGNKSDFLLAVNPGSNSISSFKINNNGLQLISTVSSGGTMPISITENKNIVYVLNGGGSGNISGFSLHANGSLHAIPGSTKPLSNSSAGAAQVSFVGNGDAVAITEKANNKIITYTIDKNGMPGMMHSIMSAHPTPFGFAEGKQGIIFVSEADGGSPGGSTVSSYEIEKNGMISLVDGPVSAGQTAACWVVATKNSKYVYATNTGSNTVSSFSVKHKGDLSVLEAAAASVGISTPIDAALEHKSNFLYVLNAGNETISVYAVGNHGGLDFVQTIGGLPDGATGMAAD